MIKQSTQPLVIFLGAGASWDSGLPLGDDAARNIVYSIFKYLNLELLYNSIEKYEENKKINFWPRFEVVIKAFEDYIQNSSKLIVETFLNCGISSTCLTLSKFNRRKIWLTTNFDNQIELALDSAKTKFLVIANREDLLNLRTDSIDCDLVIKLHGDSSVINISDNLV